MSKDEATNKLAVITGASSGIGLEFAELLAKNRYDLLICSRDSQELSKIATKLHKKYKVKVNVIALDLSIKGSADKLWSKTANRNVDILINNAGFGDLSPVVTANWVKLDSMIELNVSSLTRLSQLASKSMLEFGSGKILNVASTASFIPGPGMAVYYASKAYVLSFTEALAQELSSTGVTVTALCPGPTQSNFATTSGASKSRIFSGKLPTSKEVAEYGFKSMNQGRVVAIHGFKNKLQSTIIPKIIPRWLIRKAVNKIQNN